MPHLAPTGALRATFVPSLVASGRGFSLGFVLGALPLDRGLSPARFGLNTPCFARHALARRGRSSPSG